MIRLLFISLTPVYSLIFVFCSTHMRSYIIVSKLDGYREFQTLVPEGIITQFSNTDLTNNVHFLYFTLINLELINSL